MNKAVAFVLISVGWIASNVHRHFSTNEYIPLHPFLLSNVEIDRQWFIKDIGELVFYSIIVLVAFANAKPSLRKLFLGLFIAQALEIINYVLYFKRNQVILCGEAVIILFVIILSIRKWNYKK